MGTQEYGGVSKKCTKACNRCRLMKRFDQVISLTRVSYLRELERRSQTFANSGLTPNSEQPQVGSGSYGDVDGAASLSRGPNPPLAPTSPLTSPGAGHEGVDEEPPYGGGQTPSASGSGFRQNPLVDYDLTFAKAAGKFWYMGPSSSWSFCRRVFAFIGQRIPEANSPPDPWNFDGVVFAMHWVPLPKDECPDVSNLPPLDYALFLYNMAKFYLGGHLMFLIDEGSCRNWYAQYLLILAFGKAFASTSNSQHGPAGHQYALRAMRLLPNMSIPNSDAMLGVPALALAAVYLQSVDMRVAAYQLIGQALRICIIEGVHRYMPEDEVGSEHSRRSNTIFWVVYILDREFSALLGAPSSIRDEDITAKPIKQWDNSVEALNMALHVRLSRLRAEIMNTVYGVGQSREGSLITNTQSVLRSLAKILEDMNGLLDGHSQTSVNKASRAALRLILGHHHCVILSTRPLVMCALNIQLDRRQRRDCHDISLSPPVASLIQTCVDSAQVILRTLRILGEEDLLEGFLPFQIEDAFSSAFILHLIHFIMPSLLPESDNYWRSDARYTFEKMVSKGSVVAPMRLQELEQLERTLSSLPVQNTPPLGALNADVRVDAPDYSDAAMHEGSVDDAAGWDFFVSDCLGGLSSRDMRDLADQLDMDRVDSVQ
ncbi:hypothetical protein JX265_003740 [Neoarthrinium moseri]|uniref:Xylanolytic transcriptional activator regulatory domain-containing protein n=1 Tax=Neoarthrinium moseri TaxID=1658444 RepID=A0A9Q0AS36_9PEZI|nr:hypothetical protein JX265_003740 [Neoarthrinium moseri]